MWALIKTPPRWPRPVAAQNAERLDPVERSNMRYWISIFTLAALATGWSQAALAHAHLKQSEPAQNSSVTVSPQALTLKFSEALELSFSAITLAGPDHASIATGPGALKADDDTTLIVPLMQKLAPGQYTVNWHALSKDGHRTQGAWSFTVQP